MNLQIRASDIITMAVFNISEGNVVSLSSTLLSFIGPCDRLSGRCSKPICTTCISIFFCQSVLTLPSLFASYLKSPFLGWDPKAKKQELFHSKSRFILVHSTDLAVLAFSMFRFEDEEDEVVLYW